MISSGKRQTYIWSVKRGIVHTPECDWVDAILPRNRREGDLPTVKAAVERGLVRRTCHLCCGDEVERLFPQSDRFPPLTPEQLEAQRELEALVRKRDRAAELKAQAEIEALVEEGWRERERKLARG